VIEKYAVATLANKIFAFSSNDTFEKIEKVGSCTCASSNSDCLQSYSISWTGSARKH